MLTSTLRYPGLARLAAGLAFIAALAAPSRASAMCAAQDACVCSTFAKEHALFLATVVAVDESGSLPSLTLHIDKLQVREGHKTMLTQGGEVSALSSDPPPVGRRVLGYTSTKDCDINDCPNGEEGEKAHIHSTFESDGKLSCGLQGSVQLGADEAFDLMKDPNCGSRMAEKLGAAGVDTSCNDTFPCSTAGPGTAQGAGLTAAAIALLGLAIARRRRR